MLTTIRNTPQLEVGTARPRGDSRLRQHWGDWVRGAWDQVCVRDVEVCPLPQEDRVGSCIAAYVHLGELAPADVDVTVTRTIASGDDGRNPGHPRPAPFVSQWPMFSVASLHNGDYRFEARTPLAFDGMTRSSEWVVRVEPARAIAEPRLTPVRYAIRTRAA
jgi:hypothetical protein